MAKNFPIGVFDSGSGGLSTSKQILQSLPTESLIYFGDTKHMPYGEKSPQFLENRVKDILKFLDTYNCKAIVIACNTASTTLFNNPEIRNMLKIPIIEIISPVCEYVKENSALSKNMTLLATQATVDSQIYQKKLEPLVENSFKAVAAKEWAYLIEHFELDSKELLEGIEKYLPLIEDKPDNTVVLACTHYPYIEPILKQKKPNVTFLDAGTVLVENLKSYLEKNNLISDTKPEHKVFASKQNEAFDQKAKKTFGNNIPIEISLMNEI